MPYTFVSCGTGHSFRGTRILPYAYCGSECQSERAPALGENAFWSGILDNRSQRWSKHSEVGWKNERERVRDKVGESSDFRRRPKADQRVQWNQERDDRAEYPRVKVNTENEALNQINSKGKDDFSV